MVYELFEDFITGTDRKEVIDCRLKDLVDHLKANFLVDDRQDFKNYTNLNNKKFLELQYKGLIDLFFMTHNIDTNGKKVTIKISPPDIQ